jgi:xylan 1,4-beta-xylosidase
MVVRPDLSPSGACGLVLRQSRRFHIRVEVRQAEPLPVAQLVCCADGIDEVILSIPLEPVVDELTLRVRVAGLDVTRFVERSGATILRASADSRVLSTERAGGFVGTVVGAFAERGSTLMRSFSYEPHEGDSARR